MPYHMLDLNITFDLLSGVVALLVSYYAFRYNKLLENSTLKFISVGFVMLGIGLLIEAGVFSLAVFSIGDITQDRIIALLTVALYDILQIGAYFLFAFGYLRSAYSSRPKEETAGIAAVLAVGSTASGTQNLHNLFHLTRTVSGISEIFVVVFLGALVFVGVVGYSETRHRFSLFVMVSFALILAAHIIDLWTALLASLPLDFVGSAIQFAGFLSLLIFLISWRSRIGTIRKATQQD